jgi:hypothetical protein
MEVICRQHVSRKPLGAAPTRVVSNNAATQIGTIVTGVNNLTTTVTNSMNLSTIQIVNAGIYLFTFQFNFGGAITTALYVNISGPADSQGSSVFAWNGSNYGNSIVTSGSNYSINGSVVVPASANSTYGFTLNWAGTTNSYSTSNSYAQATRIG